MSQKRGGDQSLEGVSKAGVFLRGWRASQKLDGVSESGKNLRI